MSTTKMMWLGPDDTFRLGQVGFLVETIDVMRGTARHELRSLPAHTNQSHEPRLTGWCGTYNDVATYGRGMARVARLAGNGRALVEVLTGNELRAALERLGYPELAEGEQ